MHSISAFWSVAIAPKYENEFNIEINGTNRYRMTIISILIIVLEAVVLCNSYRFSVAPLYGVYIFFYRSLYAFLLLASIIILGFLIKYERVNQYANNIRTVSYIGAVLTLNWSVIVSITDASRGIQSFFYMFIALAISIIIVMKPKSSLLIYATSTLLFFLLNYYFINDGSLALSNYINSISFTATSWFISAMQYKYSVDSFEKNKIILEQNEKLNYIASIDPLTDIYNRRAFEKKLNPMFSDAIARNQGVTVMMMDVDYYKGYNDTYGHVKGDEALVLIAKTIERLTRGLDSLICRYGGDEFCVVYLCDNETESIEFKKNIADAMIRLKIKNDASRISNFLSLSIGYHFGKPTASDGPWDYIKLADANLYKVKALRFDRRKEDSVSSSSSQSPPSNVSQAK